MTDAIFKEDYFCALSGIVSFCELVGSTFCANFGSSYHTAQYMKFPIKCQELSFALPRLRIPLPYIYLPS